ncbi:aspartate/glutamate racemase family protein [Pelagibacterales bacterium SAG-MED01]|nr:aspartate/glutamate racemase family protein [Pelagibacterales bacterium SAG-MED01]
MKLTKIEPKYLKKHNPRVGLITLASDFRIEKDFNNVIYGKDIDLYCNRIKSYNPLTNETLKKMANDIPKVTENILPNQQLDCVAYGCTSGTIAAGYQSIHDKVNLSKPNTKVTTPITSAINALKILKIKRLSIFTPYTDEINQTVVNYFKKENIEIDQLSYFDIASDLDIGKVDPEHLFDTLKKIDLTKSDALFVSCTALPVLSVINELESKINKVVLSSNQTLIWDTFKEINYNDKVEGFGELFNN